MSSDFFEEQTEESRVKAEIVEKYFYAWANVVGKRPNCDKIAYIDLFCGPGRYKDGSASVPLMILRRAVNDEFLANSLVTIFNDKDNNNMKTLQKEIDRIDNIERMKHKPIVFNAEVGSEIVKMFEKIRFVPTLFFVDPFGYKGLSLRSINSVLKDWGCDCIIFFNYNRLNDYRLTPVGLSMCCSRY